MDTSKNEYESVEWVPLIRGVEGTEIDIVSGFLETQEIPHKIVMQEQAKQKVQQKNQLLPHRDIFVQRDDYEFAKELIGDSCKLDKSLGANQNVLDDHLYADSSGNTVEIAQTCCPICEVGVLLFRGKKYGHLIWNALLIYFFACTIFVHFAISINSDAELESMRIFAILICAIICVWLFKKRKPTCWYCQNCGREFYKKDKA